MSEKSRLRVTLKIILFAVYIVLMFYVLFVSESFGRGSGGGGLNLTPFAEIKRYLTHVESLGILNVLVNVAGNVVVFMPLGYSLPSLFTKGARWPLNYVVICATFSVSVEVLQFATQTGSCDVDDVILNTFGGFLGYLVYAFTHKKPEFDEDETDTEEL